MLMGIVRNSVLQCFCHSCRVPSLASSAKNGMQIKTHTQQPTKNVKFISTEIRCQEKTKGGLCYEVILAEPVRGTGLKKSLLSRQQMKEKSNQNIEEKLKAAEQRRLMLEASKIAVLSAKMSKIEEVLRKKDEQTNIFINQTKEALDKKIDTHLEKREAFLNDLKNKMKEHNEIVEKNRLIFESHATEIRGLIEDKLNTATLQRQENIEKMLQRLREHEEQVKKVRQSNVEKFQQLENTIQERLDSAQNRREYLILKQKQKLHDHEERVKLVREKKNKDENRQNEFCENYNLNVEMAQ